jgi:uncharacterized protein YkwD
MCLIFLAAALTAVVPGTTAQAGTRPKLWATKFLNLTNDYRKAHGVHPVSGNFDLRMMALHHSEAMAKSRTLFHTYNLATKLQSWHPTTWGENIGVSSGLRRMFKGFCKSAPHRQNLLNPRFDLLGTGVVYAHGAFWVTMDFVG